MAMILFSVADNTLNDIAFFEGTKVLGLFDGLKIYRQVYQSLVDEGHMVSLSKTQCNADVVLFIEPPKKRVLRRFREKHKNAKFVCALMESPAVIKIEWDFLLNEMDVLLSWNTLIDHPKHIYMPYPAADYFLPSSIENALRQKQKMFSMFAANKYSFRENQLYSQRRDIINFFEHTKDGDFSLYGPAWDRFHFYGLPYTNRLARLFPRKPATSYASVVDDKIGEMSKFRFCFALENFLGSEGCVTEKIHDCFRAGTVPIYRGYTGIKDIMPQDVAVYIDDFNSLAECVEHCSKMPPETYRNMLNSIKEYTEQNTDSIGSTARKITKSL